MSDPAPSACEWRGGACAGDGAHAVAQDGESQWQVNGTNIPGATNSTFSLGNVQFAYSGTYDLVISNASGLVTNLVEMVNQPPNGSTYQEPVSISTSQPGGVPVAGQNGSFTLTVGGAGIPGYNFVIECSTNLVNWQPMQTNSSPFTFTDTNTANCSLRFYRAALAQ